MRRTKIHIIISMGLILISAVYCVLNLMATPKSIVIPLVPISNKGWVLDWEENFDGDTLDTIIWSKIPRGLYDWNNTMTYKDQCFEYRDGKLILKGIVNNLENQDTSKFLTGGIYTKFKKSFKPGRFEFRVKFTSAKGGWPALWLRPFNRGGNYPYDGEIDIVEHLNHDNYVYQSVHNYYITKLHKKEPINQAKVAVSSNEYNVYGVDITPDSVIFHINGLKTFAYPNKKLPQEYDQFPFLQDWYVLMDMQLGGSWVGDVKDEDLPIQMEIDWIRHYERVEQSM